MATYTKRTFSDETVELDGHRFRDCVFVRCDVRFLATAPVELTGCRFIECIWTFGGASALTLQFLNALRHGGGAAVAEAALHQGGPIGSPADALDELATVSA